MKILNGTGGGRIDGIATASRPYLRKMREGAIDVALVETPAQEGFPAAAGQRIDARKRRQSTRASARAAYQSMRSG